MKLPTTLVRVINHAKAGQIIRKRRNRKGISLRRMSKQIGISPMFLSDLERGKRNWTQERFDGAVKATKK